ncbi:orotidine-5'-phosphate decarboxylase [Nonomuraea jiangxiensis]|uniref:Orotidine-5'-phosphate decarboxylase n=1 Tax=Nonomuraea jiangxiensis TaxID=633440 RepID=A0A1G9RAH0_9ACTN|nr:orotidine-5'-phosphate decarboxylase [Nonomuraea jiangxiensis]SDM20309.1 orotidine-5'-phosphate decarboxylase [Nonomuraea jiangxiensis]
MNDSFATRLRARLDKCGPLCVGIDPSPALLAAWGLDDSPTALERFSRTVVDAVHDVAAMVKPQSAFYERWGSRGMAVLESTIADLREAGAMVLLDVKRGDIGSTMAAYAEAYLDKGSPLAADAVTLSPYLGFGSLEGAITSAMVNDAGVFVLARTSNPEAAPLQRLVADQVLAGAGAANAGHTPFGPVGVVMGATLPALEHSLADLNGPVLAPGMGAQGASPADVARLFGSVRHLVLPSVSREVLADPVRLRARALTYRDECAALLAPRAAAQK